MNGQKLYQNKSETREVYFQGKCITYVLVRKAVKNINLRIQSDGVIMVSANRDVPTVFIDEWICSKGKYIMDSTDECASQRHQWKPEDILSDGGEFSFLGEPQKVSVLEGEKEQVYIEEGKLFLIVREKSNQVRQQKLLKIWISEQCGEVFTPVCHNIHEMLHGYGLVFPNIKIRRMVSMWGSCRPLKNEITLNSRLLETPYSCIEYVVLHEFAHFIHPNHSKEFYEFLGSWMPDWKERQTYLKQFRI